MTNLQYTPRNTLGTSSLKHLPQVPYVKALDCTIHHEVLSCCRSFWPAQTSFNRFRSSFQVGSNCTILALSPKHKKGMQESWENYENKGISHSFTYTTMPKKFATSQWTSAEQAEENNKKEQDEQVILLDTQEMKAPPGLTGLWCLHHNHLRSKAWHVTRRIRTLNSSKIRSTYGKWCNGRETLTSQSPCMKVSTTFRISSNHQNPAK